MAPKVGGEHDILWGSNRDSLRSLCAGSLDHCSKRLGEVDEGDEEQKRLPQ